MLLEPENEFKQCKFTHANILKDIEQLDQEKELLNERINELMDAEQQLLVRITNALHFRKQRNAELKERVNLLQTKCTELNEFLQSITTYSQ